jgi:hypothetical protein
MKKFWVLVSLALVELLAGRAQADTPKASIQIFCGPEGTRDNVSPDSFAALRADEVPYLVFIPNPAQPNSDLPSNVQLGGEGVAPIDCKSLGKDTVFQSALWCAKLDMAKLGGPQPLKYTRQGQERELQLRALPAAPAAPAPAAADAKAQPEKGDGASTSGGTATDGCRHDCPDPDYAAYCVGKLAFLKERGEKQVAPACDEAIESTKVGDVALILYRGDGTAVSPVPEVDEDDTLIIAISGSGKALREVRVTECGVPNPVRVSGTIPTNIDVKAAPTEAAKRTVLVKRVTNCSSDTGVKLTVVPETGDSVNIAVPTLALSRITIGLGLLYDFTRTTTWRTDAVKGESVPVLMADKKAEGLSPVAFVALRIVRVDSKNVRSASQMFAPVVGISLSAPLEHVYFGALFEPLPGFGALAGWHFHQDETVRGGYEVGDRVPGGAIATDKRWQAIDWDLGKNFYLGVYMDSKVFSAILSGLNQ